MEHKGISRRQQLELALTALLPAALTLARPLAVGRLSGLAPLIALPAGLFLCKLWAPLGREGLPAGLTASFGRWGGRLMIVLYLLWGLALTAAAAHGFAGRLTAAFGAGFSPWLFLAVGLALSLWLARGEGIALARATPLFFGAAGGALLLSLALAVPSMDWHNFEPLSAADLAALLPTALRVLALSGWAVFALCLPAGEEGPSGHRAAIFAAVVLAALLTVLEGAFGPALISRMSDPCLYLLETARLPGGLRRGEAALAAVLALADLTLLALLVRGCSALWAALVPKGRGVWLPVSAAFVLAGWTPGAPVTENLLFSGGLAVGAVVPALAALCRRGQKM